VAFEQAFLRNFSSSPLITIPPLFHLHISLSYSSGQVAHYHTRGLEAEDLSLASTWLDNAQEVAF